MIQDAISFADDDRDQPSCMNFLREMSVIHYPYHIVAQKQNIIGLMVAVAKP